MDRKEEVKNFFKEYKELCRKHNISLSFYLGDLELEEYKEENFDRLESICKEYNKKEVQ